MNEVEKLIALLKPEQVGRKLRLARKKQDMTQEEAAFVIGASRTTMVAIEKGERKIRPDELLKLSIAYEKDINVFLEQSRVGNFFTDPQFRGPVGLESKLASGMEVCIDELRNLSHNYYELERLLNEPLVKKYPSEYQLGRLRPSELGEQIALEERQRLGLGDGPIPDLRNLLARDVGLRIYYLSDFPSEYSAIYLYSDKIGGCIALNGKHRASRCRFTLAHEFGHFLTSRFKNNVYHYPGRSTRERIADQFAVHLLMPSTGVVRRFKDIRNLKKQFTPYDLVDMAHYFGVSVEALSYRLEDLRLIGTGALEDLKDKGFKVNKARTELGLDELPESRQRLPIRHQLLASQALEAGLIGEGEFADLLQVERVIARSVYNVLRERTEIIE